MRWVVLSLLAAAAFVVGLSTLINHQVEQAKARANAESGLVAEKLEARGTPLLDQVAAVAGPFVADVGAGRFAEAHARLAAPYRQAVTVDAFAKTCRASALLAGARTVTLREVRRQAVGDAVTLEARGVLETAAGAVPASFVFLLETGTGATGGPKILVMSLAGVPLLQGVTPAR